ncbi:MAG: hypothetical protein KJO07_06885 [Deltaproteobacteria bacterium]|nr:hypothetical protein [Deltaproteobacteria bacterium]
MSSSFLPQLSDSQFRIVVAVVNVILIAVVLRMRFCYEPELPAKPPRPKAVTAGEAKRTALNIDRNAQVYAEYLSRDSRRHGLTLMSATTMARAIPYRQSQMRHTLFPGKKKSSARFGGLALKVRAGKVEGTARTHLILDIENTTDKYLAYRIETRPTKGLAPCSKKRDIAYNAMAVAPKGKESRTECIYRDGWGLAITRIEVMELNPLSFYYVSSLPAKAVGLEGRLARGHLTADGSKPCKEFLSARTRRALEVGEVRWRDLIDFYARHSCETYDFPRSYTAWTEDAEGPLPALKRR